MTNYNASDPDVTRAIRSWLHEDRHEDVSRIAAAVLDQVERTPRRRVTWWPARRSPLMSKFAAVALGGGAVVVALFLGIGLLGSRAPSGPGGQSTVAPSPTLAPTPASSSAGLGLPVGPFAATRGGNDPVNVTVQIASPGWASLSDYDALTKNDDGLEPPDTVGVSLLAWSTTGGVFVYGDPCHWSTTEPKAPATTPAEIAAALAAQPSRNATQPVDVTIGGYAGKHLTLHVAIDAASRSDAFAACDNDTFASYRFEGESGPSRYHQGPDQIDEMWILDVNGKLVILDATYGPKAPMALVDELRALAESATFN
jgi:hypothetical protein